MKKLTFLCIFLFVGCGDKEPIEEGKKNEHQIDKTNSEQKPLLSPAIHLEDSVKHEMASKYNSNPNLAQSKASIIQKSAVAVNDSSDQHRYEQEFNRVIDLANKQAFREASFAIVGRLYNTIRKKSLPDGTYSDENIEFFIEKYRPGNYKKDKKKSILKQAKLIKKMMDNFALNHINSGGESFRNLDDVNSFLKKIKTECNHAIDNIKILFGTKKYNKIYEKKEFVKKNDDLIFLTQLLIVIVEDTIPPAEKWMENLRILQEIITETSFCQKLARAKQPFRGDFKIAIAGNIQESITKYEQGDITAATNILQSIFK